MDNDNYNLLFKSSPIWSHMYWVVSFNVSTSQFFITSSISSSSLALANIPLYFCKSSINSPRAALFKVSNLISPSVNSYKGI